VRKHAWRNSYTIVDATIASVIVCLVLVQPTRHWLPHIVDAQASSIYIALSAVAATLLGFMIAALTILLTIGGQRITKIYISSDLYPETLNLFHVTAVYLALTTITAILGLFVDRAPDSGDPLSRRNPWIWFVVGSALIAGWRFLFSLSILKDVSDIVVKDRQGNRRPPTRRGLVVPPSVSARADSHRRPSIRHARNVRRLLALRGRPD